MGLPELDEHHLLILYALEGLGKASFRELYHAYCRTCESLRVYLDGREYGFSLKPLAYSSFLKRRKELEDLGLVRSTRGKSSVVELLNFPEFYLRPSSGKAFAYELLSLFDEFEDLRRVSRLLGIGKGHVKKRLRKLRGKISLEIKAKDGPILDLLGREGFLTTRHIASRTGIPQATVLSRLKRLSSKGMVKKVKLFEWFYYFTQGCEETLEERVEEILVERRVERLVRDFLKEQAVGKLEYALERSPSMRKILAVLKKHKILPAQQIAKYSNLSPSCLGKNLRKLMELDVVSKFDSRSLRWRGRRKLLRILHGMGIRISDLPRYLYHLRDDEEVKELLDSL